jgi:hypothetical protein
MWRNIGGTRHGPYKQSLQQVRRIDLPFQSHGFQECDESDHRFYSLDLSYAMIGRQWINNPFDPGMEILEISSMRYPHPKYDRERRSMDQLLLKLDRAAARHTPIKLPLDKESHDKVELELQAMDSIQPSNLFLLGAGQTNPSEFSPPDVLQRLTVDYIKNVQCSNAKSSKEGITYSGKILEDMICVQSSSAIRSGQCFGDSGGPLILDLANNDMLQIGVISWGGGRDCGDPDLPGVSSRVTAGADFLRSTICAASRIPPAYLQCGDGDEDAATAESDASSSNIMDNGSLESSGVSMPTNEGQNSDVSLQTQSTTTIGNPSQTDSIELEEGEEVTPSTYSVKQPDDGSSTWGCLLGNNLRFRKCNPPTR